jgi:putative flavoprotein involved in K+ transport
MNTRSHATTVGSDPLLEEGTAFAALSRLDVDEPPHDARAETEHHEVVVIGGAQAGLSVGYHLAQRGVPFVILDASRRVGDSWRNRWDSLHLFTPRRFDQLDGMPFEGDPHEFPSKDEMADYLERYAKHHRLPVRSGTRVERLTREGERYVIDTGDRRLTARHVVVAMSSYQRPVTPSFASEIDPSIVQIHSADYRRPSQLPPGDVLIVGAGNSGAEIAMDLVKSGRRVFVSGRDVGEVPFSIRKMWVRRLVLPVLFRVVFHRLLTVDTPIGRKARTQHVRGGTTLIRTRSRDLAAAGVTRVGRVTGVKDGQPLLDDGTVRPTAGVVWCTGFDNGCSWLQLPVFDENGQPIQTRGVATGEPGLYFVGPTFLYAASSTMIQGIGRDAARVADVIARRTRETAAVA